ncbi:Aminopeptidase N [Orchesella cincta]|uniref:Aminopeptidase n=1 Tax=Orchesella cincta TaxID=48709 RepID=A0A1D2MI27_ORCCI|nr:Aminopeptidase N [Orchesella cincta]
MAEKPWPIHQFWYPEKVVIEDKVVVIPDGNNALTQDPGPDYRLPSTVIPLNYFLQIRPIIDKDYPGIGNKDTAPGFVRVTVSCANSTNKIVMHQKFLTINESSIQVKSTSNGAVLLVVNVEYDEPRNFIVINLASQLTENQIYEISIEFTANVPPNDSLRGLYSEKYVDPRTNQTKVMAATQLEPLRARQVLVCFDEPTYKATFDVVIGRTENFTSLGNGPLVGTQPDLQNPGWFWDTFNTTVKMPSYLLSLAVSEYSYSEAPNDLYRLPVRVYGPQHLVEQGLAQLTADSSAKLLQYFETKYGIPHNMLKVDSISVPYKRGAMENYGLITYGYQHYWWSDIWLNEGFVTYVSYEAMRTLWPDFKMLDYMVHDTVNPALIYDAGPSSHPIHQEAYNAEQIGVNMDTIGYSKGGAVVRMMISFLGEDAFYKGIRLYHDRLYDSVAEQDDLFNALDAAAEESGLQLPRSVIETLHTWTLQKGFPLVRVNLNGSDYLVFSQETWQNSDVRNETNNPQTTWNIPVRYLVQTEQDSGSEGSLWLLQDEGPQSMPVQNANSWILTNPDAGGKHIKNKNNSYIINMIFSNVVYTFITLGFYRTLYDDQLSNRIQEQLERNNSVFPSPARVRLLDDQFTLGFQKYVPIQSSLEFTRYLGDETEYAVWSSVLGNLGKIRNFYNAEELPADYKALRDYLLPRIESSLNSLSGDDAATIMLRSSLLEWSCTMNSTTCIDSASSYFEQWMSTPDTNPVPTDYQSTYYCEMVEQGGFSAFSFLHDKYRETTSRHQKGRLGTALACSRDSLLTLLVMVLDTELYGIEKVDSIPIFQRMLQSVDGRFNVFALMETSPELFLEYYENDVNSLVQILSPLTQILATEEQVAEFETLVQETQGTFQGALNSTLDAVKQNVDWLNEFREPITSWLASNA